MPREDIDGIVRHWRPTQTDEYLGNPHKGCCTFQRFNGDPLYPGQAWSEEGPLDGALDKQRMETGIPGLGQPEVAEGYLPSTVAYCRWFWKDLETEHGRYDFSMVEKSLEACRQRKQTLAVRLMPFGYVGAGQPGLPEWYDERFPRIRYGEWNSMVPDYDSPEYLELWGGLIRAFGRRYDNHDLIESFDISFLGPWGEGDGKCSGESLDNMVEAYVSSFARTPLLAMIGNSDGASDQLTAGVSRGSGWRADCFGDMRRDISHPAPMSMAWNHMYNAYPKRLCETGAQEAWKTAPVHFETCRVPMDWYRREVDLDFILAQGLKYHATYFMPKSCRLPEAWMDRLSRFCRKLGYRFVFRQATISRRVSRGSRLCFRAWIENVGVAPLYRKYEFALKLVQGGRERVLTFDDIDVRCWMPGDVWIEKTLEMPGEFEPGWVEIRAGLIDPKTNEAKVNFAVKERYIDRWAMVGGVEIN